MISLDRRFSASALMSPALGRWLKGFTLTALIAFGLGLTPAQASAGLILQVENATTQPGGTGSFDVVLSATSGSFAVSGFSVELSVDPASGITFTSTSENTTTSPYVFGTLQIPPLTFATFPTTDFTASDSSATAPGYVTLAGSPTVTVGLEHVTFAVAAGTPDGAIPVSIVSGANTDVLDVNANLLPFTATNGTITVVASAVPEPSSVALGLIAATMGLTAVQLRQRSN